MLPAFPEVGPLFAYVVVNPAQTDLYLVTFDVTRVTNVNVASEERTKWQQRAAPILAIIFNARSVTLVIRCKRAKDHHTASEF